MKRIIVACGSGVATSQTVASKLKRLLQQRGVQAEIEAININSLDRYVKTADIYVAITPFKQENFPIPVFSGMAILTGIGQEAELQKIIAEIKK